MVLHPSHFRGLLSSSLSDEIRVTRHFFFGQSIALALGSDGADEEGHVATQDAHDLHAFFVLHHVFSGVAMHHVPIATAHDRHLADGEILGVLKNRRSSRLVSVPLGPA